MFQLRRILLSGLVALLMVGMVVAGDVDTAAGGDTVDLPIGGYLGSWVEGSCFDTSSETCLKFWISVDVEWLKGLFN